MGERGLTATLWRCVPSEGSRFRGEDHRGPDLFDQRLREPASLAILPEHRGWGGGPTSGVGTSGTCRFVMDTYLFDGGGGDAQTGSESSEGRCPWRAITTRALEPTVPDCVEMKGGAWFVGWGSPFSTRPSRSPPAGAPFSHRAPAYHTRVPSLARERGAPAAAHCYCALAALLPCCPAALLPCCALDYGAGGR